jgi:lysophospholipase L1-like esterase
MNRIFIKILMLAAVAFTAFALPPKKKITVWIIGDSTAANKLPKAYPETGWGMKFQQFFDSNYVVVDNRALNGRGTLSFRNEGRWQPIFDSMQPGDYVFIEFGHNDEKVDKPGTGVNHTDFKANLVRYVLETRNRKGVPVLLTSIARRSFKDGVLENTHRGYNEVVKGVADSLKVPLINMEQKTMALLSSMGEQGSIQLFNQLDSGVNVNYPKGVKDNTHLSPTGAEKVAGLAAEGVKELRLGLVEYMRK